MIALKVINVMLSVLHIFMEVFMPYLPWSMKMMVELILISDSSNKVQLKLKWKMFV